jgi:pentatricopeptide repeat protein
MIAEMQIERVHVSTQSYASAICACARAGRGQEALDLYKAATAAGAVPGGGAPREMIRACGPLGLAGKARAAVAEADAAAGGAGAGAASGAPRS